MFHVETGPEKDLGNALWETMFQDRAAQFVSRHGWPLQVNNRGFEIDEYDDGATRYFISASGGRHQASIRLRPQQAGTMIQAHFPELWAVGQARIEGGYEVTRFCASDGLGKSQRADAVSELLLGLCRHCMNENIERFHGVIYPSVGRLLRSIGWPPEVLAQSGRGGRALNLCEWTPSESVCWEIQERAFDRQFRAPANQPAMVSGLAAVA